MRNRCLPHLVGVTFGLKGMLLAWWVSTEDLKLMNRLDQLELHKAMAMELKWKLENAGSTGDTSYAESTNR
ncbi:unnamed protein product [Ilex paraguariensis]|uniref:Uncharacterized protein n=1 Tax=Ilex paraguariensis TaxID=185542 RepID=A0ABC8UL29_9AQUA